MSKKKIWMKDDFLQLKLRCLKTLRSKDRSFQINTNFTWTFILTVVFSKPSLEIWWKTPQKTKKQNKGTTVLAFAFAIDLDFAFSINGNSCLGGQVRVCIRQFSSGEACEEKDYFEKLFPEWINDWKHNGCPDQGHEQTLNLFISCLIYEISTLFFTL